MKIKVNNQELAAKSVLGGTEFYQNARRGYLEFVFDRETALPVEALDAFFAAGTQEVTLTDEDTGEIFIHAGYTVRGAIRVYPTEAGGWEVAVRQFQRTAMEEMLAAMESRLAALETSGDGEYS